MFAETSALVLIATTPSRPAPCCPLSSFEESHIVRSLSEETGSPRFSIIACGAINHFQHRPPRLHWKWTSSTCKLLHLPLTSKIPMSPRRRPVRSSLRSRALRCVNIAFSPPRIPCLRSRLDSFSDIAKVFVERAPSPPRRRPRWVHSPLAFRLSEPYASLT